MRTVSELENELTALRVRMNEQSAAAARNAAGAARENRAALESLRERTQMMLLSERESLSEGYVKLLDDVGQSAQKRLEGSLSELRGRYEELTRELDEYTRRERELIDGAAAKQNELKEDYEQHRKRLGSHAQSSIAYASDSLGRMFGELPAKWFLPDRYEQYRRQIGKAASLFSSGMFEAAIGICDNTVLNIELDEAHIRDMLLKWSRYFTVLKEALETERELLFVSSRRLDGLSAELMAEEGASGGILTDEGFAFWSGGSFERLIAEHDENAGYLYELTSGEETDITALMKKNSEKAGSYTPEMLYHRAKKTGERIEEELRLIKSLKSRLEAYDKRALICEEISGIMYDCGFSAEPVESFYDDGDRRAGITAVFEDIGGFLTADVHVIPVYCQNEGKWYNCAGFSVENDELSEDIENRFRDVLEPMEVTIYDRCRSLGSYPPEQRGAVMDRELKMLINGHL